MKRTLIWSGLTLLASTGTGYTEEVFDIGSAKLGLSGFVKGEWSRGTHQSLGQTNCNYAPDPRGVLGTFPDGSGPFCQPGASGTVSSPALTLGQLTADLSYETDAAWKMSVRASYRLRDGKPDIPNQAWIEKNLALSHPEYGEIRIGTQLSRSWSRSDSFSYPIGLSSQWSETGVGYGLLTKSIRYTSPQFQALHGKWVVEGTYGTNQVQYARNAEWVGYDEKPPNPHLGELFIQFVPNDLPILLEYTFQTNRGGAQSSWAKGAFIGDIGNADNSSNYRVPSSQVHILQGDYYVSPGWKLTLGARRNHWSGAIYRCDYVTNVGCMYGSAFNNNVDLKASEAVTYDFLSGLTYQTGSWTFYGSAVRLGKAFTQSPTEYGQSNHATYVSLGVNRKIPEVYKGLNAYAGIGFVRYGQTGPAPMSLPNNTAWGVDPRQHRSGTSATMGLNVVF